MTAADLYQSPVKFSEHPHGYALEGKRLMGITGMLHEILGLGVYPEADPYVNAVVVPEAGAAGTNVHTAIELYDRTGIKTDSQTSWTAYRGDRKGQGRDITTDVTNQLEAYIRHREGYTNVANEYTVSDEERWASNIDNIWEKDGTLYLIDTKTNNLDYYPGGKAALQEYLSWQLSIYAHLFERQNPGLKVGGLACNWLRKDAAEFWQIPRKSPDQVELLLQTAWTENPFDEDEVIYTHPDPERIEAERRNLTALVKPQTDMIAPQEVIDAIWSTALQMEQVKRQYEAMKADLVALMEKHSIKSWDAGKFKATRAADSTSTTFNTTKFKKDHPDLYEAYCEQKTRKGSFTIKLREE